MKTIDDNLIVHFLLGELSESKRLGLEEQMFKDDGLYAQVVAIQEEIADDYVQNRLSAEQRIHFEEKFLRSPRRRERVEFAAAFSVALAADHVPASTPSRLPSRLPWWRSIVLRLPQSTEFAIATVAVAMAILLCLAWLVAQNRRLSTRIDQAQRERDAIIEGLRTKESEASRRREEMESEIAGLRARGGEMQAEIQQKQRALEELEKQAQPRIQSQAGAAIASFILSPGLTRGTDEPEKLVVPSTTRSVRLQLDLEKEEKYLGYVAEIRTARGNLVLSKRLPTAQRTPNGQAVSLELPANALPTGEYEISLKGVVAGDLESVAYFYVIVLKR